MRDIEECLRNFNIPFVYFGPLYLKPTALQRIDRYIGITVEFIHIIYLQLILHIIIMVCVGLDKNRDVH